ncbi:BRCT domain-containing DNA repair protein putative isoform 1 [Tripterygium wilfordii]|uniref:BRCT domain-containing DNA repair protein putative isoform 1 n=1 Tax=Tripterygium wilfordii TaxID=458696 RepID=A0A7J7CS34_TRIWF|nr:uncharacterized protein LOC120015221 [Tripterygium wilfordii]KAF5736917.1 BRCT domain-containing DNA repair protein putative isoform 1 [Tripterygium wilfordii]
MGSFGDIDTEIEPTFDEGKPIKGEQEIDFDHAETQLFDSQLSGDEGDAVEFQCLQNTEPFDKTSPVDEVLETQEVDLAGETQVLDFGGETQVVNFAGETQLLDDPDCNEVMATQLLEDTDNECAPDSDREGSDGTEVLEDCDDHSDDEFPKKGDFTPFDGKKIERTSSYRHGDKGLVEQPEEWSAEPRNSGVGSSPMFTSVRVASLRSSGLAARRTSPNGTKTQCYSFSAYGQASQPETLSKEKLKANYGKEVHQVHDTGIHHEEVEILRCENKCKVGSLIVRKLFTEDSSAKTNGFAHDSNNTEEGADVLQLPLCDNGMAGLSYVDSQEPGEASQANALNVVERLINDNFMEFDNETEYGLRSGGKSDPVLSAKGPQLLAMKASERNLIGEEGIFDWDDNREDDGGGDFFRRRKEDFFAVEKHKKRSFTEPRKPKGGNLRNGGAHQKQSNLHCEKVVHSDSKMLMHNTSTMQETKMNIQKNLINEFDEDSLAGQFKTTGTMVDPPEMVNVGFDTQMAAEAMEALFCGEGILDHAANNPHQEIENNAKVSPGRSTRGRKDKKVLPKQSSLKTNNDAGVTTRQSKVVSAKSSKRSSVSSQNFLKNVRKSCDTELLVRKRRRVMLNAKESVISSGRKTLNKVHSQVDEKRKPEGVLRKTRLDRLGGCGAGKLNGNNTLKNKHLEKEVGSFIPIAKRTRYSRVPYQLERADDAPSNHTEEINHLIADHEGTRTGITSAEASRVLNCEGENSKLGSNISGKLENATPNQHEQLRSTLTDVSIGFKTFSHPRGRRSCRKLLQKVNGTVNLDAQCKLSVRPADSGPKVTRPKRSRSNAKDTSTELNLKKKLELSTVTRPALSSANKILERNLLGQSGDKSDSRDLIHNCNLSDMNDKMTSIESRKVKHSDRKRDADSSLSSKNVGANVDVDNSPGKRPKPSDVACTTPVNCATPSNAASPVCMGNEYYKQSCKKNLSRSCLLRELNSLCYTGLQPACAVKESRKRRDMGNVRVLFSHHLDDDIVKHQKKILVRLGASVAFSITDATHFVTDKFVRTRNMLEAIASGKPVVTQLWLDSVGQANYLVDEEKYVLRDIRKEKEIGFNMSISLARARQHPLLQGQRVLITPNTQPGKEIISSLVKAVHGQPVGRMGRSALKDDKFPDDLLVLSCEEDYGICVPFLEKGAAIYSSELLLNGVVTQRLEYNRHRLFTDHVKKTRSTLWLRKDDGKFLPVAKHK